MKTLLILVAICLAAIFLASCGIAGRTGLQNQGSLPF